jgi:hypothetical protein
MRLICGKYFSTKALRSCMVVTPPLGFVGLTSALSQGAILLSSKTYCGSSVLRLTSAKYLARIPPFAQGVGVRRGTD